jgi:hypothetical protein
MAAVQKVPGSRAAGGTAGSAAGSQCTGALCADEQIWRANMLMAEVIVFWVTFHIMSVPQIFFFFMSKENLDSALVEEEEEEEGGEGEDKE